MPKTWDPSSLDPESALQRLKVGNQRFIEGTGTQRGGFDAQTMAAAQRPFAIVLGCSDSRVPAEIVFDQGLGDLFVIRVAGNVVAPSQIGSVEFAAEKFDCPLVVVLGHSLCGGIGATIDFLKNPSMPLSRGLMSIVDRIRPSVEPLMETELAKNPEALQHAAIRANVRASANQVRHGSSMIERLTMEKGLVVVGAEYNLATGEVDFFDGVPS